MCCGPCSIYPLQKILEGDFKVTGFFYNPNIHPVGEFKKRLDAAIKLSKLMEIEVIFHSEYEPAPFFDVKRQNDPKSPIKIEKQARCTHCYSIRMDKTAETAKNAGFDAFSSSLLYSRYQDHEGLIEFGQKMQERHGVEFLYEDFRVGWQSGIAESKKMGLYRQKYCGCIFSKLERDL